MNKQILVLDIDGTLTNSQKIITEPTKQALFAMQEAGKTVIIASGRPTKGTAPLSDALRLSDYGGYVLSYNGARVVHMSTGRILYNLAFPKEYLPQIYELALERNVGLITYDPDDNVITGTRTDPYMELESRINHLSLTQVDDFIGAVRFPVNKCLISGEPSVLAPLTEELREKYRGLLNVYRSEPFFLELMPPAVDKAHALERLIPALGLTADDCVCCGDGYNDISMIRYAGIGVAMGNAQPEVKEAADVITRSNDEDGLVPIIEKYFLN